MTEHCPVLMVTIPLIISLLCPLISYFSSKAAKIIVTLSIGASFICGIVTLLEIINGGTIHYYIGGWKPPLGIEFVIDNMNGLLAVFELFVSFMVAIYAIRYNGVDKWLKTGVFYSLFGLLTVGIVGMTITGDMFNMYVFLEIMSLSGYGLIALSGKKGVLSSFRYILIGTVGASCYLLAIAYLYARTGTLNMADMAKLIKPMMDEKTVVLALGLLIVAFGTKMALMPFHGWQPDAYTYSNPGAAPMIAGVMGKVPAYVLIRYLYFIFGSEYKVTRIALMILCILGICSAIFGSVMAIAQSDFRRMLAYSSIAQIGYIVMGISLNNVSGLTGATLHIINHGFMKSALFMAAGAIGYKYGSCKLDDMGQLYKTMPVTSAVIVVASLSMIGIPPTAGFFSKWYLLKGAVNGGNYFVLAALIIGTLLNAIYFFRIFERIFMSKSHNRLLGRVADSEYRLPKDVKENKGILELPVIFIVPMVVIGIIGVIGLGLANGYIAGDVLNNAFTGVTWG